MKIRMIEPGYEGSFTGNFGGVEFVDGVSVDHVSDAQARLFSSLIRVECAEDGTDPGANAQYQAALENSAPNVVFQTLAQANAEKGEVVEDVKAPVATVAYTREELEAVADKKGIAGLRDIADPMGIKSTSVKKLIDAILSRTPKPETAFVEGVDPVVVSDAPTSEIEG